VSFIVYKNTANTLRPTLKELTTITPTVYYLWEFINATEVPVYCITSDTSTEPNRYSVCSITDTSNPVPEDGEVDLDTGDYDVTIYEQSSSTNLSPTGLDVVHRDIITVIDQAATEDKVYTGGETTNKIYGG
jgi:hypothetical protein